MCFDFVDVVQAFAQFNGLFTGNSAVNSSLDFVQRLLAASIHEGRDIERFAGMRQDMFGDGAGRLAKDISEHIIQF
jgi:hypothetical protein